MIRQTLKKAAGLFVEFEQDPNAPSPSTDSDEQWNVHEAAEKPAPKVKTVEQIVKEQPGPNLDEIKIPDPAAPVSTSQASPVITADGQVSFDAIYQLAKLPAVAFSAEQILDLFASLPADLPLESKRATIRVTLGAMAKSLGVTTEQVVADASRKMAALAAYEDSFSRQANDFAAKTEVEIMSLEQQIKDKRQAIGDAKAKQAKLSEACERESARLDDVLEFFSMDVAPSKLANP